MTFFYQSIFKNRQQGFTLVELLVSVLLASIVSALALTLFFSTNSLRSKSIQVVDGVLGESNVLGMIQDSVEMAGYAEDITLSFSRDLSFPSNSLFAAGQVLRIIGTANDQRLIVRFKGPSRQVFRACNGEEIPVDAAYIRELRVDSGALLCRDLNPDGTTIAESTINNNIIRLHFRAVLSDNDDKRFITASLGLGDISQIVGINTYLLMESNQDFYSEARAQNFQFDGFTDHSVTDKKQYRFVSSLIKPRNIVDTI